MIQCHAAHRFQNRIPWANQSYSYTHASPFGLRSNRSQQRSPKVKKLQAHNLCPNVVVFLLGCLPVNREVRIAKRWTVGKLKRTKIQFPANFQRAATLAIRVTALSANQSTAWPLIYSKPHSHFSFTLRKTHPLSLCLARLSHSAKTCSLF